MRTAIDIRQGDLSSPQVHALLDEHLRHMHELSPRESVHALPIEALRAPEITLWTAWMGGDLLGCGALKQLDARHGEIKSMRTAAGHRRRGVARALLEHIVVEASRRGYARLSLETGSNEPFAPARELYLRFGFTECGPFADYRLDPNSVYMTRTL